MDQFPLVQPKDRQIEYKMSGKTRRKSGWLQNPCTHKLAAYWALPIAPCFPWVLCQGTLSKNTRHTLEKCTSSLSLSPNEGREKQMNQSNVRLISWKRESLGIVISQTERFGSTSTTWEIRHSCISGCKQSMNAMSCAASNNSICLRPKGLTRAILWARSAVLK